MAFLGIKNPLGGARPEASPYGRFSTPPYAGTPPYAPDPTRDASPIGMPAPGPGASTPGMPRQQPGLPSAPPSTRSTDPFAKENRRQTLLNIGAAFLQEDDFFKGMGRAAGGLSDRMESLKKSPNKVEYGGPGNQFEITTDETGSRTVREVPEFAKAIQDEREAKRPTLSPRDQADMRARAISAINRLPPEERQAAYADFMSNPGKYGGVDTAGMPSTYDPRYAGIMGSMGMSVPQYESNADRDRAFDHRVTTDTRRLGQGDARIAASASKGKATGRRRGALRSAPKLPTGFILD